MEKQDLKKMDQQIQQIDERLENRLEECDQRLQKIIQDFREQIDFLNKQLCQTIDIVERCKACPLCTIGKMNINGYKDCDLLREATND
jgi:hypothetical protein